MKMTGAATAIVTFLVVACGTGNVTLEEVREMQQRGEFAQSLRPLRQWVDQKDQDPEVYFMYGRALSALRETDAALWPLRKAMEDEVWGIPAGMQLASNAFQGGSNETAIAALDKVLEWSPENVRALTLRARARIESRHEIELALADVDRALEIDPDSDGARIARILALLALERVEEAGAALEQIEEFAFEAGPDQPDSARFCGARASFAKEKGDFELADERYTKCLELFPGSDVLVSDALKFYEARHQGDRVIEILTAAVKDAPNSRDFRVGLAMRLGALGRDEEAQKLLRDATDSANPALAAIAWIDLAGYLVEHEQVEEGVEAFEKVLEISPNPTPELLFRYADVLLAAERFDDALALAETMRVPAHQHFVRGRAHLARTEYQEALDEFTAGLESWPENAVARYYAAQAAEALGLFDRAIEEYRYSIRAGADETDARLRLGQLYAAEGTYGSAIAVLRHNMSSLRPDADMAELELEILALTGGAGTIPPHLIPVVNRPGIWQRGLLAIARGAAKRGGPADAVKFMSETGVDFKDPAAASILRAYTHYLASDNRAEEAVDVAKTSVEARPDSAAFHAILGLAVLRQEAAADGDVPSGLQRARAEFAKALELDPQQAYALAGSGQLAELDGDLERALDFYLRADAADLGDSAPLQQAIDVLISMGRTDEAEQKLEVMLERDPYDGPAALRLLELRVARGAERERRSRVLANLAMRFGGKGAAAIEVLQLKAVN